MLFYFDTSYPPKLVECIELLYTNSGAPDIEIVRGDQNKLLQNIDRSVVFLFDHKKRGVSLTTKHHAEKGCKVFAFKRKENVQFNFFSFSLTILSAWNNILKEVESANEPFVCTIYNGSQRVNRNKI